MYVCACVCVRLCCEFVLKDAGAIGAEPHCRTAWEPHVQSEYLYRWGTGRGYILGLHVYVPLRKESHGLKTN